MTTSDPGKFSSSNFNFGGSIQYEGDQVHVIWPHQDLDKIGAPGLRVCLALCIRYLDHRPARGQPVENRDGYSAPADTLKHPPILDPQVEPHASETSG